MRSVAAWRRSQGPGCGLRTILACMAFFLFLIGSNTAHAAPDAESVAVVGSLGERVLLVLKADDGADRRRADLESILNDFFDLPEIARLVLGRHWRKADTRQQERYLDLFARYVVAVYSTQFGHYGGQTFAVVQSRPAGPFETMVTAEMRGADGPPVLLNFRLHATELGPKVVDVQVEGVSMLISMRDEFSSVVTREGIEGLLRRLQAKVESA